MTLTIQPSFAKGEISPALYGRVDTTLYHTGLSKARNAIVHTTGGISNRPGTLFIGPVKTHTVTPALIQFIFKTTDQYVLEFGNLYIRFIRNDAYVTETTKTITGATAANPVVITANSHGYANGDEVIIQDVVGMIQLNGNRYVVASQTTNTFALTHQVTGSNINGTAFTAYSSAGTAGKIYEIATLYATADLDQLNYTQSADVMTITHPTYPARDLTRTDHNAWTITDVSFVPTQADPTVVVVTVTGAASAIREYGITAIKHKTFEESLTGITSVGAQTGLGGATAANPVVVTKSSHGFSDGDEIQLAAFTEMTEINGRRFIVSNKNTNDFELLGTDGTNFTAETSTSGTANLTTRKVTNSNVTEDNAITWTASSGAESYNIYRKDEDGIWGIIGNTKTTAFTDSNFTPDTTQGPPIFADPLSFKDNFPAASTYFEQRQVYGGSVNKPDTKYYSRTGDRTNMSAASPSGASDAFNTTLASRQVNEIKHLVPMNDLLVFTSGSEWLVNSGSGNAFELATIRQKPQSFYGTSYLRPLILGTTIFYTVESRSSIRSLGFSFQEDAYIGTNLNLLAEHLLGPNTINAWTLQNNPEPRFIMCRNDGIVLTMTYNAQQEVIAWTTWDTDGDFERCITLRHTPIHHHDDVYFVVKRKINGQTVRYIEKLSERFNDASENAFFVDSGLSLDTPITISNLTAAKPPVVTATAHGFSNGDLVDIDEVVWEPDVTSDGFLVETQPTDQAQGRYKIGEVATNTFEIATATNGKDISAITRANPAAVTTVQAHGYLTGDEVHLHDVGGMTQVEGLGFTVTVTSTTTFTLGVNSSGYTTYTSGGASYKAIDGSTWNAYKKYGKVRKAFLSVIGLDHLEGETLVGNCDGNVVRTLIVTAGRVTFTREFSRVHIGLPYTTDIETLDMAVPSATQSIQGLKKKIVRVEVQFEASRGLVIGPTTSLFVEMKQREFEKLGEPTALLTGTKSIRLKPSWNSNGRILIRQKDPMPMTILGISPEVSVGKV